MSIATSVCLVIYLSKKVKILTEIILKMMKGIRIQSQFLNFVEKSILYAKNIHQNIFVSKPSFKYSTDLLFS